MFNILENTNNNLVAIRIEGKINKRDYDDLLPVIEKKRNEHSNINMYLEFHDIEGVTPKAALDDIMTYFKYVADFDKIAVIGEDNWGNLLESTSNTFYSARIRFFSFSQKEQAKNWIENET
jgi:hypothetical protein